MSGTNFSALTNQVEVSASDQLLIRLSNSLSGADGFGRVNFIDLNNSLGVTTTMRATSGSWSNSFTTTQSNSAKWSSVYTTTNSNSAVWNSASTTVRSSSASWTGAYTPKIIYVDSIAGSDATGQIGYAARPYQSFQAAVQAGITAGYTFIIQLGAGSYSYQFSEGEAAFTNLCARIQGINKNLTTLNFNRTPNTKSDQDGDAGPTLDTELYDLSVYINLRGQDISVNDGNTYTAGSGGQLTVVGNAMFTYIDCRGGDGSAGFGTANGGSPGSISIRDASFELNAYVSCEGGSGTGPATGISYIYLDNCYLLEVTPYANVVVVARCSYSSVFLSPSTDLGGNAVY